MSLRSSQPPHLRFIICIINAHLAAAAFVGRLLCHCWFHRACSSWHLKEKKIWKMKTFSEKSHLGIVAAMVGCCRADWWMRGYCSLWNIKKLKDAKEIMNKVNQENHEAKSSELSEIRFTWGKAINSFSPYCCHMSCLLRPGFAGMKLVPGARTVKIYQVFLSVLWKLLSHLDALLWYELLFGKALDNILQGVVDDRSSQTLKHSVVFNLG